MDLAFAYEKIVRQAEPAARSSNGTPLFASPCPECGTVRNVDRRKVGGRCAPCAAKARRSHGLCGEPLYRLLLNMRARCEYPTASGYAYYGGRGIKVCDSWRQDPAAFVAWARANGYAPGLEIDRINPDGDYCPANCRFVSHADNSRNRRNAVCSMEKAREVRNLLAAGVAVSEAAATAGVPYMAAWHIQNSGTWQQAA